MPQFRQIKLVEIGTFLGVIAVAYFALSSSASSLIPASITTVTTDSGAIISWQTGVPTPTNLLYGPSLTYGAEYKTPELVSDHKVVLSSLPPNTPYFFYIITPDSSDERAAKFSAFYTNSNQQLAKLQADVAKLKARLGQAQTAPAVASPTVSAPPVSGFIFAKNLKIGDTGEDVRRLQSLLNQDPRTAVSNSGAGSKGSETQTFGPATARAVTRFQQLLGITPASGFVGAITRAKLNSLTVAVPSTKTSATVPNATYAPSYSSGGGGGGGSSAPVYTAPSSGGSSSGGSSSGSSASSGTSSGSSGSSGSSASGSSSGNSSSGSSAGSSNSNASLAATTMQSSVLRSGVTWTFDKPYPVGQFISGDYFVVGPVTVTSVSPAWDGSRNGSMVDPVPGAGQALDARASTFKAALRATYPLTLGAGSSLLSAVSLSSSYDSGRSYLDKAAVLTSLSAAPANDAFRPAYVKVATGKVVYRLAQVNQALLPALAMPSGASEDVSFLVGKTGTCTWLDGLDVDYAYQFTSPVSCQEVYSRDRAMIVSRAMMALMLQNPNQQLLINMLQIGIDNAYEALGNQHLWDGAGGHGYARVGPIAFAAALFNDQTLKGLHYDSAEVNKTSYGQAWTGASVIYNELTGQSSHELKRPLQWTIDGVTPGIPAGNNSDARAQSYKQSAYVFVGEALALRLINAQSVVDHPAFFDFVDRWMTETLSPTDLAELQAINSSWGSTAGQAGSGFITAMWNSYRSLTGPGGQPPPPPLPPTPTGFTAGAISTTQINLSWSDVAYENGFTLERSLSSGSGFSVLATLAAGVTSYQDTSLSSGTTYYYKLKATNVSGASSYVTMNATTQVAALGGGTLGPIGYWPFDGNANDAAGTVNGSTAGSFASGKIGQAVWLDGSQGVNLGSPSLAGWGITNQMTVALWVNQASRAGTQAIFAKGMWAGNITAISTLVYLSDGVVSSQFGDGVNRLWLGGGAPLSANAWHHVAVTLSGTTGSLYIDGAPAGQYADGAFGNLNDPAYDKETGIGYVADHAQIPFSGGIDDVRIYNRALSAGEISTIYQNGLSGLAEAKNSSFFANIFSIFKRLFK